MNSNFKLSIYSRNINGVTGHVTRYVQISTLTNVAFIGSFWGWLLYFLLSKSFTTQHVVSGLAVKNPLYPVLRRTYTPTQYIRLCEYSRYAVSVCGDVYDMVTHKVSMYDSSDPHSRMLKLTINDKLVVADRKFLVELTHGGKHASRMSRTVTNLYTDYHTRTIEHLSRVGWLIN